MSPCWMRIRFVTLKGSVRNRGTLVAATAVGGGAAMSDGSIVLCRCEMIRVAQVDEAIAEGNVTVNEVKRRTRAGMGVCQGAFCTAQIAQRLIASGVDPEHIDPMTARPPTRLVPLAVAAADPERAE